MALPSIDHLTLSEAHARVKKDLKACVAQPRGLGGFIYQPLALRSKPSEDNARITLTALTMYDHGCAKKKAWP